MDDEERTFSLSTDSAKRLAIGACVLGALNTSVLRFLFADPFGVDLSDLESELESIGASADSAVRLVDLVEDPQEADLPRVAFASLDIAGTSLFLALRFIEVVRRAGVGPRMATAMGQLEEEIQGLVLHLPGMRQALSESDDSRGVEPEPGAGAESGGSVEGEAADLEARRSELAAIRVYLEWVKPEDSQQGLYLAYLVSLVDYLESSLDAGSGGRQRDEVCWQALRASVPLAESHRSPREPVRAMDLDDEEELLERVRFCRRLLSIGGMPDAAADEVAWMLVMVCEPLDVLLLTRYGAEAAIAALSGLGDDPTMEAEGGDGVLRWDEEPCYARDPATAPEAFLARRRFAARRVEAAAARGFLAGVEPEPGDPAAFHAACLALVDHLERDLAAGEVDPDWEDLLWRLLRAFLPLADPLWRSAHPLADGVLGEAEARRVARLGGYCAAARPGQEGESAARGRGMMIGIVMSANRIYGLGGCSLGVREWEEARDALFRYAGRGRG